MLSSETHIAASKASRAATLQPQPPQLAPEERAQSELILIVDENRKNLAMLDSLLRTRYRTKVANRATLGLQMALAQEQPDLILLATRMSQPDGFTVCELLQSNSRTRPIPVMLLASARDPKTDELVADRGMALGAVGFIFKPIASDALLQKISQFFSSYGWMMAERKSALRN